MKKKNIGIQEFLIRHMVFIAFVSFGLLLFIWVINEYSVFSSESKLLRKKYQDSQKARLRSEVNNVADYVEYMKVQTEKRLKSQLQGRVYEAIDIATNINQENAASKSPDEIKKMVKDALRPIRFLSGRGYYFAFSMDGVETLFADRPEMEGVNMLPVQGARGEYVVKDMIDIVKNHQEGFYQYTWTKPSHEGKDFLKIAFAKYFKPFDWAIGTGEYLNDFTNQIQDTVLERIVSLRFGDEGYFFGSMNGGYPLFTDGKITKGTDRIWDLTDQNGKKIIQEQQKVSKNPEGGFVKYFWHKLGSPNPSLKISFVREIPDWGWVIGAGVYLDTIEKVISNNENTLKRELVKKLITSICVFIGLIMLIWFWAKNIAGKTRKSIKAFESSFKKATTESVTIPVDDMQFRELSRIAESANRMIDTQKHSENALRESEERFRCLAEMLPEAIFETDANLNLTYLNQQAFSLCGYSKEDIEKGLTGLDMIVPGDRKRAQENIANRFQGKKIGMSEYSGLRKDGSTFPLLLHASPIINQDTVEGLRGIIIDITERKKADDEKSILERKLLQSQKLESIGKLAGGIAHDFNNILSSIIGFTELALDDVAKGTLQEDHLQEVYKAGRRAKDLVNQILAFARQSNEERKPIRVDVIAKEVLKLIRSSIPTTIEIRNKIESHALIIGNPSHVHQILMNLCTNAAHAMEDAGGILEVGVVEAEDNDQSLLLLSDLKPGNYVKVTVSDTGHGIAPDIIGSIFEPYFTTKGVGEGTGMGLAMVHGIVETYGGKITVGSELEKGTVFSIYLPITKQREDYRPYDKEKLPSGTERIMFVDDELPIAKMGSQILERLGYSVTTRTSSVEALELFRSKPNDFDLVITDMTMPNMTGDELAMELIALRSDIPVILCTGYSKKIYEEMASKLGVKAFAYKPIVKSDLAKTVRKVLDEGKS